MMQHANLGLFVFFRSHLSAFLPSFNFIPFLYIKPSSINDDREQFFSLILLYFKIIVIKYNNVL